MEYFALNAAGLIELEMTSSRSPEASDTLGNVSAIPVPNDQPASETDEPETFASSMNSSPPNDGLYISSLITIGPTRGPLLAAPSVSVARASNVDSPVLSRIGP